jgi:4-hydroxy-tetrahydrodipicolinate synthase
MLQERTKIRGVITAVLTPFDKMGRPDFTAYQAHIRTLEREGCNGILLLGTTGEGPSMSLEERKDLLAAGREATTKMAVMACTTCANLPETAALTRHAFEKGADAVTVMPPFFFKGVSDEGLYNFYRQVLEEAVPDDGLMMLYHIPQVTGVPVTFSLLERLIELDGRRVAGIKDSAGSLEHCQELCRCFPELMVFTGNDQFILEALRSGASGCVTGVVNVFAPMAVAIYHAHIQSDPAADELQKRFRQVWAILDGYQPYPSLLKALISLRYREDGWRRVRPPLAPLEEDRLQELLLALTQLELDERYDWIRTVIS